MPFSTLRKPFGKALNPARRTSNCVWHIGANRIFAKLIPLYSRRLTSWRTPTRRRSILRMFCLAIYLADRTQPRIIYDQLNNAANQLLARDAQSFDGLRLNSDLALLDKQVAQAVEWLQKANRVKPMQANVILPLVESLFGNNQPVAAEDLAL